MIKEGSLGGSHQVCTAVVHIEDERFARGPTCGEFSLTYPLFRTNKIESLLLNSPGGGGTSLKEANGDVSLDGVSLSRLD